MSRGLKIGELAHRAGVNVKTVRYYDLLGLLPPAERTESGYRLYGEREAARLTFIRKAKRAGLSLDEIQAILDISDRGERPCQEVRSAVEHKIAQLDRQIAELISFREELTRLREEAEHAAKLPAAICPVIEQIGDGLEDRRERGNLFTPGRGTSVVDRRR